MMNHLNDNEEKAASGLDWGFELESIVLEIIGDAQQISEETLVDLLMDRAELQTLVASFAEFIQKIPELQKKHGKGKYDLSGLTVRDEMKILLGDLTSGLFHNFYQNGAHRKLQRKIVLDDKKLPCTFIKCITDDYNLR